MLILYIRNLDNGSLAKRVYLEQKIEHWPGLAKETEEICRQLKIENVHETSLKKTKYRKIALKACHQLNKQRILSKADGKIKYKLIQYEDYGIKNYVKKQQIDQIRKIFKTRFGMHPFAGNFSHDKRFSRTDWLCKCLKAQENEKHLISGECEIYGEIRDEFQNLDDIENLTKFFDAVLKKRDELDEVQNV